MATSSASELDRARAALAECGVVDLHVDSIIQHQLFGYDVTRRHRAGLRGQPFFWHADIPRMLDASYAGVAMGIHWWREETARGTAGAHKQIDYLDTIADQHPECVRIRTPDDWAGARDAGKLGMVPGLEGAHMLNGSLDELERFCDRGVAYLTLAHFSKNSAATPSLGKGANEDESLTSFGEDVVRTLNRRGVVVDVAHLNQPCAIRAATLSRAPVFATHSGAKGVRDHARLLSDEAIDRIADGGGAIGIIFGPGFLAGRRRADSGIVVDHIDYIVDRVGISHVAIGSDYDGWLPAIPSDQRDCRDIVRVAAEMLRRGYDTSALVAVFANNAWRVISDAWAARDR